MDITHSINEPIITASSDHAFPLSILSKEQIKHAQDWYLARSIQIYGNNNKQTIDIFQAHNLNKLSTPFVSIQSTKDNESIEDSLVDYLNNGYYVRLYLDQYYLQYRARYSKSIKTNDTLIYGYNSQTDSFKYIAVNKNGVFEKKILLKEHILNAFKFANPTEKDKQKIYLYKLTNRNSIDIKDLKNTVLSSLDEYLNVKNSSKNFPHLMEYYSEKDYIFGVDNYNLLISHLESAKSNEKELNITNFQILSEHKQTLLHVFHSLQQLGNLDSQYTEQMKKIFGLAENLKKSVLRYMLTRKDSVFPKLIEKIKDIQKEEVELLEKITTVIK
ncbi:hypothetical protein [Bacillus sp. SM2101]|uniref:hypothetical protein n=1 Tax=Bacillus sp. SM2101 TaxID=2805366 RepID=UPI001BDF002B|nr:hypothetical protein [Bacillus sp. SM2101]